VKDSPLSEVVRDRRFNLILGSIRKAVQGGQPITISPRDVDYIRRTFHRGLSLGEQRLHALAQRLLAVLAPESEIQTTFVVWGRCSKPAHTEILRQSTPIESPEAELYVQPDSEVSKAHAPVCVVCGLKSTVILSFVRYKPELTPDSGLTLLSTRIKTTSNLCYKVADMVFDIDRMFRHDKIHGQFSQVVSDVYGIKVILKTEHQIEEALRSVRRIRGLTVLEEKDYTGLRRKRSGFEAYKVTAKSRQQLFEIQFQSRAMFEREESHVPASHRTYKEKQMEDRRKLVKEYADLYRALIKLLSPPDQNLSEIDYIELGYTKKGLDDEF
jgi:ppGpp synthetase/RelA/SpoT-type nucleotidyltranferase